MTILFAALEKSLLVLESSQMEMIMGGRFNEYLKGLHPTAIAIDPNRILIEYIVEHGIMGFGKLMIMVKHGIKLKQMLYTSDANIMSLSVSPI